MKKKNFYEKFNIGSKFLNRHQIKVICDHFEISYETSEIASQSKNNSRIKKIWDHQRILYENLKLCINP